MSMDAFDLTERFQTPVFVLSDLDLGMNDWMAEPFPYLESRWDRGKVLSAEDLAKVESFARYKDVDGDGVPYRTLPGTPDPKAAYFTRGSGRNDKAQYSERPDDYVAQVDRLARKFETARAAMPKPVVQLADGAQIGLIAYGTSDYAVEEARAVLLSQGVPTNYLRVRAFPFDPEIRAFVERCERVYVIDQNRDAQMRALLRLEFPDLAMKFDSITHYTGLPLGAQFLTRAILEAEKGQ